MTIDAESRSAVKSGRFSRITVRRRKDRMTYALRDRLTEDEFRMAVLDLSERVQVRNVQHVMHQCLESAAKIDNAQALLDAFVDHIENATRCHAVGIRLKDDHGNTTCLACKGFNRKFFERESRLSFRNDRHVRTDGTKGHTTAPPQRCVTPFGSLYINETGQSTTAIPPGHLNRTLKACQREGYASVALIPIPIDRHISGIIHVADHSRNRIPLQMVEVLEQTAFTLGLALQRFHMQDRLRKALENQRELVSQSLKIQEEERQRIAMELHDQTGQDLNVLILRLNEIRRQLKTDQHKLHHLCDTTERFTRGIIDTIRRIIHGLNPSALETLGLVAALKQMIREYAENGGMRIEAHLAPLNAIHDRNTQVVLYRMVQEAVNNAYKHAEASLVNIHAQHTDNNLTVTIEDDGNGFTIHKNAWSGNETRGMGIATMKLRSQIMGARLNIESQPGSGTRITITLPVEEGLEKR